MTGRDGPKPVTAREWHDLVRAVTAERAEPLILDFRAVQPAGPPGDAFFAAMANPSLPTLAVLGPGFGGALLAGAAAADVVILDDDARCRTADLRPLTDSPAPLRPLAARVGAGTLRRWLWLTPTIGAAELRETGAADLICHAAHIDKVLNDALRALVGVEQDRAVAIRNALWTN